MKRKWRRSKDEEVQRTYGSAVFLTGRLVVGWHQQKHMQPTRRRRRRASDQKALAAGGGQEAGLRVCRGQRERQVRGETDRRRKRGRYGEREGGEKLTEKERQKQTEGQ